MRRPHNQLLSRREIGETQHKPTLCFSGVSDGTRKKGQLGPLEDGVDLEALLPEEYDNIFLYVQIKRR